MEPIALAATLMVATAILMRRIMSSVKRNRRTVMASRTHVMICRTCFWSPARNQQPYQLLGLRAISAPCCTANTNGLKTCKPKGCGNMTHRFQLC